MAKTDFASGTTVTSTWLDSHYVTGGGHRHDGGANDGCAPKIRLGSALDVDGQLPQANQIPPRGYIDGFVMSYANASASWRIDLGPGHCIVRNTAGTSFAGLRETDDVALPLIDVTGAAFVVFDPQSPEGGVPTACGSISDGMWLHLFALYEAGIVGYGFDTSPLASNLVDQGFSMFRRLGSVRIEDIGAGAFGIRKFRQEGDEFIWEDTTPDHNGTVISGSSFDAVAVTVPPDVLPMAVCVLGAIHTGGTPTYWRVDYQDGPLGGSASNFRPLLGMKDCYASSEIRVVVNASRQFYAMESIAGSGTEIYVWTRGWTDRRGRDDNTD